MGEGMIGEWAFLHLDRHVVQKCLAGQQEPYWGEANKRKMFFIYLVPVRFMLQVPRDRPASRVYIPFPNTDWVSVGE